MDRSIAWFLYCLCFAATVFAAYRVFGDLQAKEVASNYGRYPALVRIIESAAPTPDPDKISTDLWFKSVTHERASRAEMTDKKPTGARMKLDDAIEVMENLKTDNPKYRPDHTNARLESLKDLRDSWKREIRAGDLPVLISTKPKVEPTTVMKVVENVSPAIEVPQIGSSTFEVEILEEKRIESFITWNGEDTTQLSPSEAPIFSDIGSDSGTLISGNSEIYETERSDPSSIWYRAYSSARQAKELEAKGSYELARRKYQESKTCYDILNQDFPEFESEHIKIGSELLAAKLTEMTGTQ